MSEEGDDASAVRGGAAGRRMVKVIVRVEPGSIFFATALLTDLIRFEQNRSFCSTLCHRVKWPSGSEKMPTLGLVA